MPDFDKFDVCEAYYQLECDYNKGGWLHERPSNQRRMESTDVQLHRMGFRVGAGWRGYESLSENGKEIYHLLRRRYGFDQWDSWKQNDKGEWVDCDLIAN
jgi:hypothetical protein